MLAVVRCGVFAKFPITKCTVQLAVHFQWVVSFGRTTIPPPLSVGLITMSLRLLEQFTVDCCRGEIFCFPFNIGGDEF